LPHFWDRVIRNVRGSRCRAPAVTAGPVGGPVRLGDLELA